MTPFITHKVYICRISLAWSKWKLLVTLREEFYGSGEDDSPGSLLERVFLPRIGLIYAIQAGINAYGSYNKGFDPFEASTSLQEFNQPFKPLISATWETGIKAAFLDNRLYTSFALYSMTVQNVAVNAQDISNPNLFVQQGENRSNGLEAEVSGKLLPSLDVMLAYAYDVAKVTKSDVASQIGMLTENAPRNSGSGWIKYTFLRAALKGFGASAGYTFAGQRNTLDPGTTLPGYIVFTGGLHYVHKHITLALNLNNITNKMDKRL